MIYIKKLLIGVSILPMLSAQDLCPPAFLETYSYDQKVDLYWEKTSSYGDVLFNECFASCSTASDQMMVVNDTSLCGDCSGGWFRYNDGTDAGTGTDANDDDNNDNTDTDTDTGADTGTDADDDDFNICSSIFLNSSTNESTSC